MIVSEIIVAVLLAVQFNAHSGDAINKSIGAAVIFFICLFVAGFGAHLRSPAWHVCAAHCSSTWELSISCIRAPALLMPSSFCLLLWTFKSLQDLCRFPDSVGWDEVGGLCNCEAPYAGRLLWCGAQTMLK